MTSMRLLWDDYQMHRDDSDLPRVTFAEFLAGFLEAYPDVELWADNITLSDA